VKIIIKNRGVLVDKMGVDKKIEILLTNYWASNHLLPTLY